MSNAVVPPPHVHTDTHKDYEGSKLGMWLFLFTEILLFGGLFILYSAYRARYPMEFHEGGQHLNVVIGVANTIILLTSSLTVALAITAIQRGNRRLCSLCLAGTIAMGLAFLVNKYIEWSAEIGRGLYPNSPVLVQRPHHVLVPRRRDDVPLAHDRHGRGQGAEQDQEHHRDQPVEAADLLCRNVRSGQQDWIG